MRTLTLLLAAAVVLPAEQPSGFQVSATNDLLYQQNELAQNTQSNLNKDWRQQYQESLFLTGSCNAGEYGNFAAGITARSVNFYQQDTTNTTLEKADQSLYRKYLKYSLGGFSLQAGNFHAMLGRGLVLSVLPIDKLLKERTIDGGEARFQGDWLELRGLAGTVRTETQRLSDYQQWRVEGGEILVKFLQGEHLGSHRLGLHAARIDDLRTDQMQDFQASLMRRRVTGSASLSGENLGQVVSYYVESARMNWERKAGDLDLAPLDLRPPQGEATYANFSLHPQHFYLLAEYKRYQDFENDLIAPANTLNNPPLADREDEKNNLIHNEAARVLMQVSFADPDITFFISGGRLKENFQGPFNEKTDIGHNVYGGFTVEDLWDHLTLAATYGVKRIQFAERRADVAATYKLGSRWSLELKVRDKRHPDAFAYRNLNRETDYNGQIAWSPWLSVYYMQQFRSDPGPNFVGRHRVQSGGLRLKLWKSSFVDISGGEVRGGLVCSGGQCRELPDFKGWKVATHLVF